MNLTTDDLTALARMRDVYSKCIGGVEVMSFGVELATIDKWKANVEALEKIIKHVGENMEGTTRLSKET